MTEPIESRCPGCQLRVQLVREADGRLSIAHEAPACTWALREAARPDGGAFALLRRPTDMTCTFKCPGCGQIITAQGSTPPVLVHPLPMCERFERVDTVADATDLMREARAASRPETFH